MGELLRKLILMGTLVLFESVRLKMVVALLVCVVSVANLNYFKPHRNSIVQKVAQASFLLTTFKYVLAIVLIDVSDSERLILGGVLVFLDVCFVLGSLGSIVAVFYLLKSHVDVEKKGEGEGETAMVTKVIRKKIKRSLTVQDVQRAVTVHKIDAFEKQHAHHHNAALDSIRQAKEKASKRVQIRVQERNTRNSIRWHKKKPSAPVRKIQQETAFVGTKKKPSAPVRKNKSAARRYIVINNDTRTNVYECVRTHIY